jgi:hypothetical protein
MSSLLRPIVLESFQAGLRRRSFINSLTVVPQYLPESPSCAPEDSAVFDSDEIDQHEIINTPLESSANFVMPVLSPVTDAHISDYESKITIPRHHNTLYMIATSDASSPTSTSPYSAIGESKPILVKLERLRWRLASGFFAYFICGWGDGGKLLKKEEFRRTCSFISSLVTGTVIPCELLILV